MGNNLFIFASQWYQVPSTNPEYEEIYEGVGFTN